MQAVEVVFLETVKLRNWSFVMLIDKVVDMQ